MSVTPTSLLESLFEPCPPAKFLGDYWPDKPLSAHGDFARLPQYLRCEALRSFVNLAARYHGRVSFGNSTTGIGTAVAKDAPTALLRQMGLSLYMPDLAAYVPDTDEFLRGLERELGARSGVARIGAFAAAVHNGVTSHYDAEEVISVQLEGEKLFFIAPMKEICYPYGMQYGPGYEAFDELYPQMDAGIPKVAGAEFECIEMRPGSVLFMPRGTWHRTEATQASLSVSIIVRQPSAFEAILEQLRLALLCDPAWRCPLYYSDKARAYIAKLLDDLPHVGQALNPDDVITAALPEPARLARLDETCWLQRVPNALLLLNPHPLRSDTWMAVIRVSRYDSGERDILQLDVPPNLRPIFQWLAQEERPLRVDAVVSNFPSIPFTQIKTVLGVLVRATYLKLLRHVPRRIDH